jgi:hypothetical protein
MSYSQTNIPILDRKEAQTMVPVPVASAAGITMIAPDCGCGRYSLWVTSATAMYLYDHNNDGWSLIPSGALAGTFAAGTTGVYHPWSANYTANGGSTSTITVSTATHALTGICVGATIEFLTGTAANVGLRRTVTDFSISGTTATITFTPVATAVVNTDTFKMSTGRFFVLNAYTALAAGVWKSFDICSMTWSGNLGTTTLPAAWATDGNAVLAYQIEDVFATGKATSGSSTTLVNNAKAWTVDQWIGYQLRITAGTGQGQTKVIADSDATSVTIASGATLDDTSYYSIEGNQDKIFLLGNGAVTMYAYTISADTWAVVSPVAARVGAPTTAMLAEWVGKTGDTAWGTENTIQDGKWIYSPRGAATATMTRYNIPGNTWETLTTGMTDTLTTGSSMTRYKEDIFFMQNATGRIWRFNIPGNYVDGYPTEAYTQSTAAVGIKMWIKLLNSSADVVWLYYILNTSAVMRRIMVY